MSKARLDYSTFSFLDSFLGPNLTLKLRLALLTSIESLDSGFDSNEYCSTVLLVE